MAIPAFAVKLITNWAINDIARNGKNSAVMRIISKLPGFKGNSSPAPTNKPGPQPDPNALTGAQGWGDPANAFVPTTGERFMYNGLLPTLGTAISAAGNGFGMYNNAFAAALAAAANDGSYKSGTIPDPGAGLKVIAAMKAGKGNIYSMLGNAIGGRINNISDIQRQENALARREALMQNSNGAIKSSAWGAMGSANNSTVPINKP